MFLEHVDLFEIDIFNGYNIGHLFSNISFIGKCLHRSRLNKFASKGHFLAFLPNIYK